MIKNNVFLFLFYIILGVILTPLEFVVDISGYPDYFNFTAFIVIGSVNLIAYYLFSQRFLYKQNTILKNLISICLPSAVAVIILITKPFSYATSWYFAQFAGLSKLPSNIRFESFFTVVFYFVFSMAVVFLNFVYRDKIKAKKIIIYILIMNVLISIFMNLLFHY